MSDNGNGSGQYQAIRVEVDAVKGQLHEFKDDINTRFTGLSDDIRSVNRTLSEFIQTVGRSGGESFYKVAGIVAGAVGISLTIIGGFGSLAKVNLDTNIAFTNDKIAVTNTSIDKLASVVSKLSDTTIPRPELEYRINTNRDAIKGITDTQDKHSTQIASALTDAANLKADVERLKGDIVTRRENEGHWGDLTNRVDLLSNRLTDTIKANGGGDIGDQLKQLRDQVNDFQRKFIAVPAFPKYNDK